MTPLHANLGNLFKIVLLIKPLIWLLLIKEPLIVDPCMWQCHSPYTGRIRGIIKQQHTGSIKQSHFPHTREYLFVVWNPDSTFIMYCSFFHINILTVNQYANHMLSLLLCSSILIYIIVRVRLGLNLRVNRPPGIFHSAYMFTLIS